jgi:hypothetical protein
VSVGRPAGIALLSRGGLEEAALCRRDHRAPWTRAAVFFFRRLVGARRAAKLLAVRTVQFVF